jgi:hypothetical protein
MPFFVGAMNPSRTSFSTVDWPDIFGMWLAVLLVSLSNLNLLTDAFRSGCEVLEEEKRNACCGDCICPLEYLESQELGLF